MIDHLILLGRPSLLVVSRPTREHHTLGSLAGHRSRERRAKRMTEQGQWAVGAHAVQDLQRLFKKEAEVISDCRAV